MDGQFIPAECGQAVGSCTLYQLLQNYFDQFGWISLIH